MKKLPLPIALLSFCLLCTACQGSGNADDGMEATTPLFTIRRGARLEEEKEDTMKVYRGRVDTIDTDGITVTQMPGYDYGYESILFMADDSTLLSPEEGIVQEGAFVEVYYDGTLTRSLPPQGTAQTINVVADHSDGIIVNGEVQAVAEIDGNFHVTVLPLKDATSEDTDVMQSSDRKVELIVSPAALQDGLVGEDLVSGTRISAVTCGIATLSMPAQQPTLVVLPYRPTKLALD